MQDNLQLKIQQIQRTRQLSKALIFYIADKCSQARKVLQGMQDLSAKLGEKGCKEKALYYMDRLFILKCKIQDGAKKQQLLAYLHSIIKGINGQQKQKIYFQKISFQQLKTRGPLADISIKNQFFFQCNMMIVVIQLALQFQILLEDTDISVLLKQLQFYLNTKGQCTAALNFNFLAGNFEIRLNNWKKARTHYTVAIHQAALLFGSSSQMYFMLKLNQLRAVLSQNINYPNHYVQYCDSLQKQISKAQLVFQIQFHLECCKGFFQLDLYRKCISQLSKARAIVQSIDQEEYKIGKMQQLDVISLYIIIQIQNLIKNSKNSVLYSVLKQAKLGKQLFMQKISSRQIYALAFRNISDLELVDQIKNYSTIESKKKQSQPISLIVAKNIFENLSSTQLQQLTQLQERLEEGSQLDAKIILQSSQFYMSISEQQKTTLLDDNINIF